MPFNIISFNENVCRFVFFDWIPKSYYNLVDQSHSGRSFEMYWHKKATKKIFRLFCLHFKTIFDCIKEDKKLKQEFLVRMLNEKNETRIFAGEKSFGERDEEGFSSKGDRNKSKNSRKLHHWFEFNLAKHMHHAIFINSSNYFRTGKNRIIFHHHHDLPRALKKPFLPWGKFLYEKLNFFRQNSVSAWSLKSHLGYWCFFY